jgi:hypothetical protein
MDIQEQPTFNLNYMITVCEQYFEILQAYIDKRHSIDYNSNEIIPLETVNRYVNDIDFHKTLLVCKLSERPYIYFEPEQLDSILQYIKHTITEQTHAPRIDGRVLFMDTLMTNGIIRDKKQSIRIIISSEFREKLNRDAQDGESYILASAIENELYTRFMDRHSEISYNRRNDYINEFLYQYYLSYTNNFVLVKDILFRQLQLNDKKRKENSIIKEQVTSSKKTKTEPRLIRQSSHGIQESSMEESSLGILEPPMEKSSRGIPPPFGYSDSGIEARNDLFMGEEYSMNSENESISENISENINSETIGDREKELIEASIKKDLPSNIVAKGKALSPLEELKQNYEIYYHPNTLNIIDIGDEENALFHSVICNNNMNPVLIALDNDPVNHAERVKGLRNKIGELLKALHSADDFQRKLIEFFPNPKEQIIFYESIIGFNSDEEDVSEKTDYVKMKLGKYIDKMDTYWGDQLTIQLLCDILDIDITIITGIKIPIEIQYKSSSDDKRITRIVSIDTPGEITQYKLVVDDKDDGIIKYYNDHIKNYVIKGGDGVVGQEYIKEIYNLSNNKDYDNDDTEWKPVNIISVNDDYYEITIEAYPETGMSVPGELLRKFQMDKNEDGSHLESLLKDIYVVGEQGVFILCKNGQPVLDQDVALISQTIAHELDEVVLNTDTGGIATVFNVVPGTPPQHDRVTTEPVSALKTTSSPGVHSQASVAHSAVSSLTQNTHVVTSRDITKKTDDKKVLMDYKEQMRLKDYKLPPPKLPPVTESDREDSAGEDTAKEVVVYENYFQMSKKTTDKIPHIGVEALVEIEEKLETLIKAKESVDSDIEIKPVEKMTDDTIPEPKFNEEDIVTITYKKGQQYKVVDVKYIALYQKWSYGVVDAGLETAPGDAKTYFDENRLKIAVVTTAYLVRESSKRITDKLKKQEKQIEEVIKKAVTVKVFKDNMPKKSSYVKPNEKETMFSEMKRTIQNDSLINMQRDITTPGDGSVVSFRQYARNKYKSMPGILSDNGIEYSMEDIEAINRHDKLTMLLGNIVNFNVSSITDETKRKEIESKIDNIIYNYIAINGNDVDENDRVELKAQLIDEIEEWTLKNKVTNDLRAIVADGVDGPDTQFTRVWGNKLKKQIRDIKEDQEDFKCYQCQQGFNCSGDTRVEMEHKLPATIFNQYVPFIDNFKIEMKYYKPYRDSNIRRLESSDIHRLLTPMRGELYLSYMYRFINCVLVSDGNRMDWWNHVDYLLDKWIREFQIYMFTDIIKNMKNRKTRAEYKKKLLSWTISDRDQLAKDANINDDISTIFTVNSGLQIKHQVFKRVLKCMLFECGYSHHFCNQVKISCNFTEPGVRDGYLQLCYDLHDKIKNGNNVTSPSGIPSYALPRNVPGSNSDGKGGNFNPSWTRDSTIELVSNDYKKGRQLEKWVGSIGKHVTLNPDYYNGEKKFLNNAYIGGIDGGEYTQLSAHLRNTFEYMQYTLLQLTQGQITIQSRNKPDDATHGSFTSVQSKAGNPTKYTIQITPEMIYYYNIAKISIKQEENFQQNILKFLDDTKLIKYLKTQYKNKKKKSRKATEKATPLGGRRTRRKR